eukprot:scaffold1402_cov155-Amphora_coffeaeformis.AAC.2
MGWGHEGRIEQEDEEEAFPPKYTYLILQTGDYKTAFCDPRKFGKSELRSELSPFEMLAPDAWQGEAGPIIDHLVQKSLGIKALLLDQKRACCGVGNWVADEVLYQCQMHPDQSFLTMEEATRLVSSLQSVLATAVDCLAKHIAYPADWLFPYRWTKKKAGKDGKGRSITFLQSGGRTSAIIASEQKLYKRKRPLLAENDTKPQKLNNKKAKAENALNGNNGVTKKEAARNMKSHESGKDESRQNGRTRSTRSQPKKEIKQATPSAPKSKTRSGGEEMTMTTPSLENQRRRSPRFVSP